jgi:hypothetical protein
LPLTQCQIPYMTGNGAKAILSNEVVPPARAAVPPEAVRPSRGRRRDSWNRTTLAAATLRDGEALGLTRRAVEAALAGNMLAMKLCLKPVLPRGDEGRRTCGER